ncbi:hypothetical protein F3K39_28285 [Streptomyces sp. LBUM 1479]|uniref:hypothetical protein n=1 Tax=Streptomyces scabiei TaxID=1930 RepID=UPI001B3312B9|nr:hypothetical protein [Streptomyces scabiei]MBP5931835.1 hypothetical protein [Streptomyces sp. LBUM 1479]MDX3028276.1 hypothetical protein [Streptomyces scabiei]
MTAHLGPVPPFPRWTGVQAYATGPHHGPDGGLAMTVSARLTRRARLWARWRLLTGKGVPGAAA